MKKNPHYSVLFKAHIAMAAIRQEAPVDELAERFCIPVELIEKWHKIVVENLEKSTDEDRALGEEHALKAWKGRDIA